jgi:predicted DNA-binding transcriptional regulator YafY
MLFLKNMLSVIDAWIKAAVEHKTLEITYHSGRTKGETTCREVEPDYCGQSIDGKNIGLWGICRLRGGEIRCFKPDSILRWRYIGNTFAPNPRGRWQELIPIYKQKELDKTSF